MKKRNRCLQRDCTAAGNKFFEFREFREFREPSSSPLSQISIWESFRVEVNNFSLIERRNFPK